VVFVTSREVSRGVTSLHMHSSRLAQRFEADEVWFVLFEVPSARSVIKGFLSLPS